MKEGILLDILEIAILIVFPLVLYYRQSGIKTGEIAIKIIILYLIWYLSYAMLHELCHMLGIWITGKTMSDYRLIPHFWEGNFKTAYVIYDFNSDPADFIVIILPYARDVLFSVGGILFLGKYRLRNLFISGLIIILFILSPVFDIVNNYLAFLLGHMNDFNAIRSIAGGAASHIIGIVFSLITLLLAARVIFRKEYIAGINVG